MRYIVKNTVDKKTNELVQKDITWGWNRIHIFNYTQKNKDCEECHTTSTSIRHTVFTSVLFYGLISAGTKWYFGN